MVPWAENFREKFSRFTATLRLPLLAASESRQIDTSIQNGGTRQKAAAVDGLLPPFFKDGGEVLTSDLTKLLRSVWERGELSIG